MKTSGIPEQNQPESEADVRAILYQMRLHCLSRHLLRENCHEWLTEAERAAQLCLSHLWQLPEGVEEKPISWQRHWRVKHHCLQCSWTLQQWYNHLLIWQTIRTLLLSFSYTQRDQWDTHSRLLKSKAFTSCSDRTMMLKFNTGYKTVSARNLSITWRYCQQWTILKSLRLQKRLPT